MENEQEELELEIPDNADDSTYDDSGEPKEQIDWKATAMRYKKKIDNSKNRQAATKVDTSEIQKQLARLELKTEGYTEDSISFLEKVGGREALKDPHVKAAIDSIQEQKKAEAAVTANETSKSDIERKFSQEEMNAMSAEELYKILPKARK